MPEQKTVFLESRGVKSNVFSKFTMPRTGPIYLATKAAEAGHDVSVFKEDLVGRELNDEELAEIDVLCISDITPTYNNSLKTVKRYKKIRQEAGLESRAITGGIHASMMPQETAEYFDTLVIGEAESLFPDILEKKPRQKIIKGKRHRNLDEAVPIPNFKLLKDWQKIRIFPVITSRGCPHDCSFCSVTEMFGRQYRFHSPERVLRELDNLEAIFQEISRNSLWRRRISKNRIFFADDNFAVSSQRAEQILDGIIQRGYGRQISCQVRADVTESPRIVEKMARAGIDTVYVGFESVNSKTLKEMNKKQTVEDIAHSISVFHNNGIGVLGMFIFGADSDTKDDFNITKDFCHEHGVDYVQYSILTPLPGTPFYRDIESQGRLLHKNWDMYDAMHAVFQPKNMTALELQEGTIQSYQDFYNYSAIARETGKFALRALHSLATAFSKFPPHRAVKYQIAGTYIAKKWLQLNQGYLNYLRKSPRANKKAG